MSREYVERRLKEIRGETDVKRTIDSAPWGAKPTVIVSPKPVAAPKERHTNNPEDLLSFKPYSVLPTIERLRSTGCKLYCPRNVHKKEWRFLHEPCPWCKRAPDFQFQPLTSEILDEIGGKAIVELNKRGHGTVCWDATRLCKVEVSLVPHFIEQSLMLERIKQVLSDVGSDTLCCWGRSPLDMGIPCSDDAAIEIKRIVEEMFALVRNYTLDHLVNP